MAKPDLPAKLYFRIGEVARIIDVEPHVLRYWENEFATVRPQKSAKGQRIYSRRDVESLLKIKDLLYAHRYTIAGARKKLRQVATALAPVSAEPRVILDRVGSIRSELGEIRSELVKLLESLGG